MSTGTVSEDGLFKNVFCKSDLPFTMVYSLILQKQLPVESPRQFLNIVLQLRSPKSGLQAQLPRVSCKSALTNVSRKSGL